MSDINICAKVTLTKVKRLIHDQYYDRKQAVKDSISSFHGSSVHRAVLPSLAFIWFSDSREKPNLLSKGISGEPNKGHGV